jgi:lysozyme
MSEVITCQEIKFMSEKGIDFLINEEGIVLHPYKDRVGVWTIGIGSTMWESGDRVKPTDKPISRERAISLFRTTLANYEKTVWSCTRDDISQNNFDALVSLCYNIGINGFRISTVVERVNNNPKDPEIRDAFLMWKNAGGKPILLGRRKREADLYFS